MATSHDKLYLPKETVITSSAMQAVSDAVWKGRDSTFATTTGTSTAYVLTLPTGGLYANAVAGDNFSFIAHVRSTLAPTLTIVGSTSVGPYPIVTSTGGAASLMDGAVMSVTFNGAEFQVVSASSSDLGWFNVKSYGAAGDGVTDDTVAFQAAADAATAACVSDGGAVLFFPPGEYVTNKGFVMLGANGAQILGYGATLIYGPTAFSYEHCISLSGDNTSIEGITITSPNTVTGRGQTGFAMSLGTAGVGDTYGTLTTNVAVRNCTVYGVGLAAMWFSTCKNVVVTGNTVSQCLADGIHFSDGCEEIVCSNNVVSFCEDDHIAVVHDKLGAVTGLPANVTITGNTITGDANLWGGGVVLIGVQNAVVSGNSIVGLTGSGISTYSAADTDPGSFASYLFITGNNISNCGRNTTTLAPTPEYGGHLGTSAIGCAILLTQSATVTISDNYIHNLDYAATNAQGASVYSGGVVVKTGTDVTITGNHFADLACDAVWGLSATTALTVSQNSFGYCARTPVYITPAPAGAIPLLYCTGNNFYNTGAAKDIDIQLGAAPAGLAVVDYNGYRTTSVASSNTGHAKKANFRAYNVGAQSIGAAAYAVLTCPSIEHDVTSSYNAGANAFYAPNTGYYVFTAGCQITPGALNNDLALSIVVQGNISGTGSQIVYFSSYSSATAWPRGALQGTSAPIYLTKGQYVQAYVYTTSAYSTAGGSNSTYFGGYQLQ
jgi:hypothetical protein